MREMNIQDPRAADPAVRTSRKDSAASNREPEKDKAKAAKTFSKVLAEKSDKGATDFGQTGEPQTLRETVGVTQQAKPVAKLVTTVSLPPALQNLVQEISVAAGPLNHAQVDIQLNSKTFDGLRIAISHTDGNVSIQMLSRTPEVAAVLNRNVDQLSQALAVRGIRVESIQVRTITSRSAGQGRRSGRHG